MDEISFIYQNLLMISDFPENIEKSIESSRSKLFKAREKRIHPGKDDKILTDWNGLMIAALAKASQAFDEPEYAKAAKKAADFILSRMHNVNGRTLSPLQGW